MPILKKGSAAAKAFMAKLRAARGKNKPKAKKVGAKKTATKKVIAKKVATKKVIAKKVGAVKKVMPTKKASSMHKDTKSHNVNIKVVSGIAKSKETQFYEIIRDNYLMQYFNTYGKTYAKFNANVKTNIATGKKSISPLAIEFYKKIENLPLKFTAKAIGKKTKHFEYINGKNQDTYHQLTEYKVTI